MRIGLRRFSPAPRGSGSSARCRQYNFFRWLWVRQPIALEGGYANLASCNAKASGMIAGGPIAAGADGKSCAVFLDALGFLLLSQAFSNLGKACRHYCYCDQWLGDSGRVGRVGQRWRAKWVRRLGIGAWYSLNRNVGLRAEYEYYFHVGDHNQTGESDVQVLTAGLTISF